MKKGRYVSAYYTLIKNNSDQTIDENLAKFLLYQLKKKNYTEIGDINQLCNDFQKIIGFEISYFKMQNILGIVNKSGYLEYNKNSGIYVPNFNKISNNPFIRDMFDSKTKFSNLIKDFRSFAKTKFAEDLSLNDAEKIIANFIEEQGMLLFELDNQFFNECHDDYLFAKFLKENIENNTDVLDYVNDLVLGRILSESMMLPEDFDNKPLNDLTIYLDSGFIFRLLGLDNLNRTSAYIQLLDQMHSCGMTTKIFDHTYSEVSNIITNSIKWVNNPLYDQSKASETTYYFVTNNYTAEQIEILSIQLKEKLIEFGISIECIDYPQKYSNSVISEAEYFEIINQYYKETNDDFDEFEKQYTIEMDARSLFYIDYLNNGLCGNNIADVPYMFLSTNYSLSKITKKILTKKKGLSPNAIPYCISDKFMGVLLWKTDINKLSETNYNQLLVSMEAALLPNKKFQESLSYAIKENKENGNLTAEQCYILQTSRIAHRYMMDLTKGNISEFTIKTPIEVLHEMYNNAKNEGIIEERVRGDQKLLLAEDENKKQKQTNAKLVKQNIDKDIRIIESEKKIAELNLDKYNEKLSKTLKTKSKINRRTSFLRRAIFVVSLIVIVAFIVFSIISGIYLWGQTDANSVFSLYTWLVLLPPTIISIIVNTAKFKETKLVQYLLNKYKKYLDEKYGYNKDSEEMLVTKINDLEEEIASKTKLSEKLMNKK